LTQAKDKKIMSSGRTELILFIKVFSYSGDNLNFIEITFPLDETFLSVHPD